MNQFTPTTGAAPLAKVLQKAANDKMQEWRELQDENSETFNNYFNAIIGHLAAAELVTETARKALSAVELTPLCRHEVKHRAKMLRAAITKFDTLTAASMEESGNLDQYDLMAESYCRVMRRHVELLRQSIIREYHKAGMLHAEALAHIETARTLARLVSKMGHYDADKLFFIMKPFALSYTDRIADAIDAFADVVLEAENKNHPYGNINLNESEDIKRGLQVICNKFHHGVENELRADAKARKLLKENQ